MRAKKRWSAVWATVGLRVDRLRGEEPLDKPGGGAVGEALELGDADHAARPELLEDQRMRDPRRPAEGAARPLQPPVPAVRARERIGSRPIASRELGERPQPLPLRRRLIELPRQRRERPPSSPAANVIPVEERLRLVPERARLARAAVVIGRLAHEIEPLRPARARGVEEVAVAGDRIRTDEPRAALVELPPRVVVEERRAAAAPRQAALLEPEHERRVEAPRPRAQEVDDGDPPGLIPSLRP
jgi:hypothetical protein